MGKGESVRRKKRGSALHTLPDKSAQMLRLNGLCPYYTMFPLSFPFRCLRDAEAAGWAFDPYCGRGTLNFAARLRGIPSTGIDSNPVAAAIARAKLIQITPEAIIRRASRILEEVADPQDVPVGEFWERAYHEETLLDICRIRKHLLDHCDSKSEIALRALMLGILHGPKHKRAPTYLSNQMPRTYATKPGPAVRFWRRRRMKPQKVDVLGAITRRARYSFAHLPPEVEGDVLLGDSRVIPLGNRRFKWIITSPPYYGMRSYYPDQWLRNWFLGGPDHVEYAVPGQISHKSEDEFVHGLATVWKRASEVCLPGAKLVVRFGALPSCKKDPNELLRRSLRDAECGWRITTVRNAGSATRGRRQYDQFGPTKSEPVEEIDLYATLEN